MMKFDYFYGLEAGQFNFIRLPKLLMTQEKYAELSAESKVLYGLLMDRMGDSRRNKWIDDAGRVYVIYPVEDIQDIFRISRRKAMADLTELEEYGLIDQKPGSKGLQNRIYVKKLNV